MTLFPGTQREGFAWFVQGVLLRVAFIMQDVGEWLREHGRGFEDWVCPSGRRAVPKMPDEFWMKP